MLTDSIVKALGQYRQYRARVLRSKRGNATKIEHKMELLKERVDDLINIDPHKTQQVLNFIEYFSDAGIYTFNEAELLAQPYRSIRIIYRTPRDTTTHSDASAETGDDPAAKEKLKTALAALKTR